MPASYASYSVLAHSITSPPHSSSSPPLSCSPTPSLHCLIVPRLLLPACSNAKPTRPSSRKVVPSAPRPPTRLALPSHSPSPSHPRCAARYVSYHHNRRTLHHHELLITTSSGRRLLTACMPACLHCPMLLSRTPRSCPSHSSTGPPPTAGPSR